MNVEELQKLLDRYYNGESTEEEELRLSRFFTGENIPAGYDTEKILFSHFKTFAGIPAPSPDFESRILSGVDASEKTLLSSQMRRYILPVLSAAAGLIILAGSYFFFINRPEAEDTFKDPQMAYNETVKILMGISSQLNHGARALKPVSKLNEMADKSFSAISTSTSLVGKSLNYLENLAETQDVTSAKNNNN
jgi:hypothetical protein